MSIFKIYIYLFIHIFFLFFRYRYVYSVQPMHIWYSSWNATVCKKFSNFNEYFSELNLQLQNHFNKYGWNLYTFLSKIEPRTMTNERLKY